MDSKRFDRLTRSLAAGSSRRSVLGTVLAAAGAALFPRSGRAACIPPGEACRIGDDCCDGFTCFEAVCDCPSGYFDADGRCDPPTRGDPECLTEGGGCSSNADCCIDDGLTCQEGVCLPAITVEVGCSEIGGPCGVDLVCCGSPATTCPSSGICACAKPLILDRTGLTCVATCSYPDEPCTDDSPCCEGAGTCLHGLCRCPDDLRPCGATCVDPTVRYRRDPKNCGARGAPCRDDEIFCEGVCVATEALSSDPDHCGDCCTACHPEDICCDGTCGQPFSSHVLGNVCCESVQICAPGDGTEICCAAGEVCHNGGCCRQEKVCGETCCGQGTTCQCGECVPELRTCEGDGDCCGQRCVDGVCCPGRSICVDEAGAEFCCGVDQQCGPVAGTCESAVPADTVPPIRTPRA